MMLPKTLKWINKTLKENGLELYFETESEFQDFLAANYPDLRGPQLAQITGLHKTTIIKYCRSHPKIKVSPKGGKSDEYKKKVFYKGREITVAEFARICGMPYNIVNTRLGKGWSLEEVRDTPYRPRKLKRKQ